MQFYIDGDILMISINCKLITYKTDIRTDKIIINWYNYYRLNILYDFIFTYYLVGHWWNELKKSIKSIDVFRYYNVLEETNFHCLLDITYNSNIYNYLYICFFWRVHKVCSSTSEKQKCKFMNESYIFHINSIFQLLIICEFCNSIFFNFDSLIVFLLAWLICQNIT